MPRRFAAWFALAAVLASLAAPVHAVPARGSSMGVGSDLCIGGKLVPAVPANGVGDDSCAACCGSTSTAPARVATGAPALPAARERPSQLRTEPRRALARVAALARAPPR